MNGRRTAIGFTLVAAGSLAVLWLSNLPLGVPGEWEWDRIPTARGEGEWTATQVMRVLERLDPFEAAA